MRVTRLDGKPGTNPPLDADGDFVVGPDYVPAPEFKVVEGVARATAPQSSMDSKECKRLHTCETKHACSVQSFS
jgi:hypothetical protein